MHAFSFEKSGKKLNSFIISGYGPLISIGTFRSFSNLQLNKNYIQIETYRYGWDYHDDPHGKIIKKIDAVYDKNEQYKRDQMSRRDTFFTSGHQDLHKYQLDINTGKVTELGYSAKKATLFYLSNGSLHLKDTLKF